VLKSFETKAARGNEIRLKRLSSQEQIESKRKTNRTAANRN